MLYKIKYLKIDKYFSHACTQEQPILEVYSSQL